MKTLIPLSQKLPNLKVIATPNEKSLLDPLFTNVIYLEPGQNSEIQTNNGSHVKIRATAGPVLGPPWKRPENGYIVTSPQGRLSLYYEPHCVYDKDIIGKEKADIVITPVVKQKQMLQNQGWKYEMQVSMLEIYNETIRDLLSTNRPVLVESSGTKQYVIKHDANGNTHVSDLTIIDVQQRSFVSVKSCCTKQLQKLLVYKSNSSLLSTPLTQSIASQMLLLQQYQVTNSKVKVLPFYN